MRFFSSILWLLYKIAAVLTILIYSVCYWVLSPHWLFGFLMISLPVLWIGHGIAGILLFSQHSRKFLLPLCVLLLGWPFFPRTYRFPSTPDAVTSAHGSFKILNYNVYGFGLHARRTDETLDSARRIVNWISNTNSDVICFQEYYSPEKSQKLNIESFLRDRGYRYKAFLQKTGPGKISIHDAGIVTFSKYPIVDHQELHFDALNGLVRSDIVIHEDTIRIINAHLFSMTLKLRKLTSQKQYKAVKQETRGVLHQMKRGFINRNTEVHSLESWIRESPYPVIVCGDFNETPYSYVYGRIRKMLKNAFEEKGSGFGFTFNRLPKYIRIDNQFYDGNKIDIQEFSTRRDIYYSDHHPLIGTYQLRH